MAYTIIPNSVEEIKDSIGDVQVSNDVERLFLLCLKLNASTSTPLSIDSNDARRVKIRRSFSEQFGTILKSFEDSSLKLKLGDGSRGRRGPNNRGIVFEKELYDDFWSVIIDGCVSEKVKNKEFVRNFLHTVEFYDMIDPSVLHEGRMNKKRPLTFHSDGIYVGGRVHDIGGLITDLTLSSSNKLPVFMSLKHGRRVSFANLGTKSLFSPDEISENGSRLLKMLGVEEDLFFNQFKLLSGPGCFSVSTNSDIEKFIRSGFGHGYYLIQKVEPEIYFKKISKNFLRRISKISSICVEYPRRGKLVYVRPKNDVVDYEFHLRNNSGGVFPNFVWCGCAFNY